MVHQNPRPLNNDYDMHTYNVTQCCTNSYNYIIILWLMFKIGYGTYEQSVLMIHVVMVQCGLPYVRSSFLLPSTYQVWP